MEIRVRPWRRDDLPAAARILKESWLAAYGALIPEAHLKGYLDATYRIDALGRLYESPFIHGCIGECDGLAVGFARTQFHRNENRLYLASLYLLPGFQGRGIGSRLLLAAEEKAPAYGLHELWVGVMMQNAAARAWYGRRGFRFVGEVPFHLGGTAVRTLVGCKTVHRRAEGARRSRPRPAGPPVVTTGARLRDAGRAPGTAPHGERGQRCG